MGWGPIGDLAGAVAHTAGDAFHGTQEALSGAWNATTSFVADNWKTIAVIAATTLIFVAVTVLTGGLGAPALLALTAGALMSGAGGYVLTQWLDGAPVTVQGVVTAALVSTVVTLATAGLGRAATPLLTPIVDGLLPGSLSSAVPAVVESSVGKAVVGGPLAVSGQVLSNALTGQPLDTGLGQAYVVGTVTGGLQDPIISPFSSTVTGALGRSGPVLGPPAPRLGPSTEIVSAPPPVDRGIVQSLLDPTGSEGGSAPTGTTTEPVAKGNQPQPPATGPPETKPVVDRPTGTDLPATETQALLDELERNGVKVDRNAVVKVGRTPDGKIVFLEEGTTTAEALAQGKKGGAGLKHVLEHEADFAKVGVSADEVPEYVFEAVTKGKVIGHQGSGKGRPIYEFEWKGETRRVAVTVGSNGFIVGANPSSGS